MPTNKTHTERIVNLETRMEDTITLVRRMKECEDEQANHDVSIEDLHTRLEDMERKFPDLKGIKTHIDSLYQGLLDVDTRVTKLNARVDLQMSNLYVAKNPTKKNTKSTIENIARVVVGILFTTFN